MLDHLLSPLPEDDFFQTYWTRQFVHIPGPPDKFRHLFSWDVLNRTLEQHRLAPPRLRLVRAGKAVLPGRYLDGDAVEATGLMSELANGATLVLDCCDEMHAPLRALCVEIEQRAHAYVYTNLYAGWRTDNGFDVHWDPQDTLILQVAGRKRWQVWAPTRPHPFADDVVDTSSKTRPDGPPVWEGVLEQGGVLSMPRGWWHVARPMDEPCLHLTVTIKNPNGIDLLEWFARQMKSSETARMELPVVASGQARRAWLEAVWQDLRAAWSDDLVDRYVAHLDQKAKPRPSLRLPDVAAASSLPVDRHTPLELALPRPLQFETINGAASFVAQGVRWKTGVDLVPALSRFNDRQPHTLDDLSPQGGAHLIPLLTALVMKGILRRGSTHGS